MFGYAICCRRQCAANVQWEHYRTILTRCFRELSLKPDKQKVILRLICSVLDSFHFMKPAKDALGDSDATNEDTDSSITFSLTAISSDKQDYLRKVVFTQVQKLLGADPEKVIVNINLVALKLLKLLPVDYFEAQLSSIIHRICNFLKNHLESIRDEARSALAASLKELGIGYLQFVVKILRAILKRGFQLHVLGYTLHYLLSKNITTGMNGRLDYCLEDLLAVVDSDLFGDVAEQKEVEKIASKMKETEKRMPFETLKLIAQSITFKQHLLKKLISPVSSHLKKKLTTKLKTRLEMMLHNIALGIECNPSTETSNLFTVVYWLIKDTTTGSESESEENTQSGPGRGSSVGLNFPGLGGPSEETTEQAVDEASETAMEDPKVHTEDNLEEEGAIEPVNETEALEHTPIPHELSDQNIKLGKRLADMPASTYSGKETLKTSETKRGKKGKAVKKLVLTDDDTCLMNMRNSMCSQLDYFVNCNVDRL